MDPLVNSLLAARGLQPPAVDEAPLEEHWNKMRRLRSEVDETLLADNEVALRWTAVEGEQS